MGCGLSNFSEEEGDAVSLCRERKRLIKSAVERRHALAKAHRKYTESLRAVAMAIRLFVARHSSSSSPFLITFPQPSEPKSEALVSNPMYLQQRPTEDSVISSHSTGPKREKEDENEDDDEERVLCEHFYDNVDPPTPPLSQNDSSWDFFNLFEGVRPVEFNGFAGGLDGDLKAVREAEGIPQLEEDEDNIETKDSDVGNGDDGVKHIGIEEMRTVVDGSNVSQTNHREGVDTTTEGRELLEALKDVEDHFIRAYESGVDFSKMLEINIPQSGMEELKEKPIQSITWSRSMSYQSSSCKSFLSSSSKNSSTWTEFSDHLFYEHGGMESGSHLFTLERLYAWEKKLYEEVKAGEQIRKIYQHKCSQLSNKDSSDRLWCRDKTSAEVGDLFSRISVSLRYAESISKRIQKLRDEELQPQLVELLQGMREMWKVMFASHQIQNRVMVEVKSFACPPSSMFTNDLHHLSTLQLEAEIQNWRSCFSEYVSSQKEYAEALHGWLSKFMAQEIDFYPHNASSVPQYWTNRPLLLMFCQNWLASMQKLPDYTVAHTIKFFGKDVRALWVQQEAEQQQKRKVDKLTQELDRKILAFQRFEGKLLELKPCDQRRESELRHGAEHLEERKSLLDMSKNRLVTEKAKYNDDMEKTQRIILNGFQTGFSSVFESLTKFSMVSVQIYTDIVAHYQNGDVRIEMGN